MGSLRAASQEKQKQCGFLPFRDLERHNDPQWYEQNNDVHPYMGQGR